MTAKLRHVCLMLFVIAALTGCTPGAPAESPRTAPTLIDPLTELTDSDSARFVAEDLRPVLHRKGLGRQVYTTAELPAHTATLTIYVACTPSAAFTVRSGSHWFAGECAETFQNSGGFPLTGGTTPSVTLEIASGTRTWLVAVPEETPAD